MREQHWKKIQNRSLPLAVAAQRKSIMSSPGGPTWSVVEAMTLPEAAVLFSNGSKTTSFTSLVDRSSDPVDFWVTADSFV